MNHKTHFSRKTAVLALFALLLALLLALGACGQGQEDSPEDSGEPQIGGEAGQTGQEGRGETQNGGEAGQDGPEPQIGGEAVWVTAAFPPSLDPHIPSDVTSRDVIRQVFEPLLAFGPGDVIEYRLATSFRNIDPVTWEFTLRQGVTFHDGTPFNAEAVYITYSRILDPENAKPRRVILEMIAEIVIVNDYTIQFITNVPFGPFPAQLTNFAASIISPAAIAEEAEGGRPVVLNPVGTGPFQIAHIESGDYIRLTRFDDYWGGTAYLDSVVFRTVPDPATRLLMLQAGETNGLLATVSDIFDLETMAGIDFVLHPSMALHFIGMNTTVAPFNDVRVRQAISMAINVEDILYGIMEGHGFLARGPIHPSVSFSPFHELETWPFDVDAARALIQEAGAYGAEFEFLYFTGDATRTHIAQLVQSNLAEIGLTVNIASMEWASFLTQANAGQVEMYILSWANSTGDADGSVHALFHSMNIGGVNRARLVHPRIDYLIDAGRSEADPAIRYGIYRELAQLIIDEAPMVFTFHPYSPFATRGIEGLFLDITGVPYFHRVWLR